MNRIMVAAILVASPRIAEATDYYVDSILGSDSNNGTSPATPWQNLSKVNSSAFLPGDKILLARGRSWTGSLAPCSQSADPSCSGNILPPLGVVNPIRIDAYGSGAPRPLRNLEITNTGAQRGPYWGIHVLCDSPSFRLCRSIYLGHNYIHDINGTIDESGYINQGGIGVMWHLYHPVGSSNYFDGVTIEHNTITGVDRWLREGWRRSRTAGVRRRLFR